MKDLLARISGFFDRDPSLVAWDVADITLVALVLYYVLLLLRGTRAMQMGIGLGLVFGVYQVAKNVGLITLYAMLDTLLTSVVVLIVVITYVLALKLKDRGVFQLAIWCFSGFASLFPLVFAAIYWKRATKAGAYACVVTASIAWIYLLHQSGYGADREFLFLNMMPVATIIGLSTTALVLVSLVTRPPSRATIEKFFGSGTEDTASASARA